MLHVASVCTPCCMLLDVVAQSLKPVKLFSQQLPTFLLFRDRRSVAQQCWIRLHSSSNIVGPTHAITHGLQRLMGCILPTMHRRSQYCWELLHPFSHLCQHARNNSQHCWRNNVGSFKQWNDVMFFSFPQARFFQETSREMDVKLSMLLYKTNRQHFDVISR